MKFPVQRETVVSTTTRHRIDLDRDGILSLLGTAGYDIPRDAKIFFSVPGGSNWSGSDINISKEDTVTVAWEVTTQETKS